MAENVSGSLRFMLAGISLRKAIRQLKPAYPKKRDIHRTVVTFAVGPDEVTITLPGAAITVPCRGDDAFTAEIPYTEFQQISKDRFEHGDLLMFGFSRGALTFRSMTTRSVAIRVSATEPMPNRTCAVREPEHASGSIREPPMQPSPPGIPDLLDGPIGLPLLGMYRHLLRFDPETYEHLNPRLWAAHCEIEAIFSKASRILHPLGVPKEDLERLVKRRLGLGNDRRPRLLVAWRMAR